MKQIQPVIENYVGPDGERFRGYVEAVSQTSDGPLTVAAASFGNSKRKLRQRLRRLLWVRMDQELTKLRE